jgi:L-aminopeptidase/D-esterase-like protein
VRQSGLAFVVFLLIPATLSATFTPADARAAGPRARDLGVPFDGTPGDLNAITDVAGVLVGHTTLISGEGKLQPGKGPIRTGVTAVLPRGRDSQSNPVFAAWFSQNGNGEMTGTTWIEESGFLEGPVMITNTHSVGVVRDATIQWRLAHGGADATGYWWSLPVVGETWDGWLNDINGFHVKPEHAVHALDTAHGGAVEEGSVGGGTGMICNGYKGGIGTASRRLDANDGGYTIGVLVQCNYGRRDNLRIAGIPVGREIPAPEPYAFLPSDIAEHGSIIVAAASAQTARPSGHLGARPQRQHFRQRIRRYIYRLFDGKFRRRQRGRRDEGPQDAAQRFPGPRVSSHGRVHRGSHRQRHGGGDRHDGCRRSSRHRTSARTTTRSAEEIWAPGDELTAHPN